MKKFIRHIAPFLMSHVVYPLFRLLLWSCRIQIEGEKNFYQSAQRDKLILVLWHNSMAPIPFLFPYMGKKALCFRYATLTSKSKDGELFARIVEKHPLVQAIRIPGKGKHQALRSAIETCQKPRTVLLITPDGPKGPACQTKSGAVHIARKANAEIIALSWKATRFWILPTWDKLRIPKPFSKILVRFSSPVSMNETKNSLQEDQKKMQKILSDLDESLKKETYLSRI